MAYTIFQIFFRPYKAFQTLQKTKKTVIAAAGVLIIGAVLSVANTTAIADDNSVAEPSGKAATSPSSTRYDNNDNAGQALVSGTSTLHDWTVKGSTIKGNAQFLGEWKVDSSPAITLKSIDLSIPVNSLKSTEGGGMDDTMYDALKIKQFPTITYGLTKAGLKTSPSKKDPDYHFDTTGQLTVAGKAHAVNLDLVVLPHDNGKLTITTEIALKMTDFGVSPPTAMLGMIKSGDAITLKVTWELTIKPSAPGPDK